MKCGEVKLKDDKRLQQMDQFNWICPACFLTALPFADASILSDEGECCAQTLNSSNLSNTSVNSLPEFIKSRNNDDRQILIMHLNINGIQNKFEGGKQLMKDIKVFFLTETKVDATYPTAQFKMSGYDIYRNDRTKGGGAILAFVSSRTPSKKLARHRKFSTVEPLIVEAKFGKYDVVVVGIKRPQKSIVELYYVRLEEELNDICTFASLQNQFIIVLGDLNLDRLRPERREGKILLDLEDIHGYSCLIDKPAH